MTMRLCSLAVTALAFTAFVPATSEAQPREPAAGWWEWALPEIMGGEEVRTRRGQVAIPRRTPRDRDAPVAVPRGGPGERGATSGRGQGRQYGERGDVPAFCRTGEGHPVFGWQWCVEKGFGGYSPRWERERWENIILRVPRSIPRPDHIDRNVLIDIMGADVFRRFEERAQRAAASGPIVGRLIESEVKGGQVLQLRAGDVPLAELTDLDGDRRVDVVLLNARER
jgi:hypothetical protein